MTYVTNEDIEARLGTLAYVQLTDDAGTGSADTDKVDEARLGAEGEVNSYLARRYAVPLSLSGESELAAVLKSVVLDLVSYRLHGRRPPIPADVVRRRAEAVAWLAQAASGLIELPLVNAPPGATAQGIVGRAEGPARLMTRESMENL